MIRSLLDAYADRHRAHSTRRASGRSAGSRR
jgi:hypothetical protein